MRETIHILDRNGNSIQNDSGALSRARNLSWRSQIPGGYAECSFEVPVGFVRGWDPDPGYWVDVRDGLEQVFYGRIEDLTCTVQLPGPLTGGYRKIQAFGPNQETLQRTQTATYTAGTIYTSDAIKEALVDSACVIMHNLSHIDSTGVNIVSACYNNAYISDIVSDAIKFGDSASPPNQYLWAVWGQEEEVGLALHSDWHEGTGSNVPRDYNWSGANSGLGEVAYYSGSGMSMSSALGGGTSDAAIVMSNATLPADKKFTVKQHAKMGPAYNAGSMAWLALSDKATAPAIGSTGNDIIQVNVNISGCVRIIYYNSSSAPQYWNGSAWGSTATSASVTVAESWYKTTLYSDGTQWQAELANSSGTVLTTTTAVTWANTRALSTGLWMWMGDGSTSVNDMWIVSACVHVYAPFAGPTAHFWARDTSAYDLQIPLSAIQGDLALSRTTAETANAVTAAYGSTSLTYTAASTDATSIAAYDRRDMLVNVGNVPVSVANNARSTALNARKDPAHRLGQLRLKGYVRNATGARFPLNRVRAGMRFVIQELSDTVYVIGHTDYNAETGELSITPDGTPTTLDMLLAQAQKYSS